MKRVWETCRCGRAIRVPVKRPIRCTCGSTVTPCSACLTSDCDNCPFFPQRDAVAVRTSVEIRSRGVELDPMRRNGGNTLLHNHGGVRGHTCDKESQDLRASDGNNARRFYYRLSPSPTNNQRRINLSLNHPMDLDLTAVAGTVHGCAEQRC